jgi:hypothetical protein
MPENSGPWSQARSPSRGQPFMAGRNVKCFLPETGRLFRHLGMQKVFFQGSKEYESEYEKDLSVAGKITLPQSLIPSLYTLISAFLMFLKPKQEVLYTKRVASFNRPLKKVIVNHLAG